jgi:hypothetical protein
MEFSFDGKSRIFTFLIATIRRDCCIRKNFASLRALSTRQSVSGDGLRLCGELSMNIEHRTPNIER